MLFDLSVSIASAWSFHFYTLLNINSTIFYAYSSDSEVFLAHRNDRYGLLEMDVASNWLWKLTIFIFFVGMMPTIILLGMEVEDGGGGG
jgi:hypothetical protein